MDNYGITINLEDISREELDKFMHVIDKVLDLVPCGDAIVKVIDFNDERTRLG